MAAAATTILTIQFGEAGGIPLECDVHLSNATKKDGQIAPVLIHWHGGGIASGARWQSQPQWLIKPILAAGGVYITPDYRLLSPSNGHEIAADAKAMVDFVADGRLQTALYEAGHTIELDSKNIMLGGQSAGALVAALAILHCPEINFRCFINEYGCGGENFTPDKIIKHQISPTFFTNRTSHPEIDIHDPLFFGWAAPFHTHQPVEAASTSTYDVVDGRPTKARMYLMRFYLQTETFLDVYTGEDGLQQRMHSGEELPEMHQRLFPMLVGQPELSNWPPTIFIHGDVDSTVLLSDSLQWQKHLTNNGVQAEIAIVPNGQHGGDLNQSPEILADWKIGKASVVAFVQSFL